MSRFLLTLGPLKDVEDNATRQVERVLMSHGPRAGECVRVVVGGSVAITLGGFVGTAVGDKLGMAVRGAVCSDVGTGAWVLE